MLFPRPDSLPALRDALKDRYDILGKLGRGAMGIVYLAHEVALDRPVALKLLPPGLASRAEERERFLREARIAARLNHPNIVPIYAVDQVGELVFFAMRYVEGETLGRRVWSRGPLPPAEVARVLHEVARAVHYAHRQGVIHRDLKAENILLERGTVRALVTDFGIARLGPEDVPEDQAMILGTPAYMSPEQCRGEPADERSDVYALGVLGYFAARGELPFTGLTVPDLLRRQVHEPPPRLALEGHHGVVVSDTVRRALTKAPADRFQSAEETAEALESIVAPREMPVAIRVLLGRMRSSADVRSGFLALGVFAVLGLVGSLRRGQWGDAGWQAALLGLVLSGPLAMVLPAVRRVLKDGFSHQDLADAAAAEHDRVRDETDYQFGPEARRRERLTDWGAYGGLGLVVVGAVAGVAGLVDPYDALGAMVAGAGTTLVVGLGGSFLHSRRRDRRTKRWLRFWRGWRGKWFARLAGAGLERPAGTPPAGAGASAEVQRMFEALPEPARKALADVPGALRQLETQALKAVPESVEAFEAMRLELLGLHTGATTLERLRAHVDQARVMADAVDRLLAENHNPDV